MTIPKPDGGERELGIPTVTDRLIQQALLQVLQPILDPTFSEHSYGFRPGRGAHDAVLAAQSYVQSGRRIVVRLRPYVRGWKAYFRLAQTPKVGRELTSWLRHRLRAIQLKQWKRGTTMHRELLP
ncbi:group II intron maturase-specific domain-containing protein [Bradyrhizobium diazoefficiens]|uniref:group II intron maturase-specific domain-containing protein n=1 Tax=Bradyrhizobium diazoefficiens TaxID=1355477 RepID=UPI0035123420